MNKLFWIQQDKVAGRCGPSTQSIDLKALKNAGFSHILCLDANEVAFYPEDRNGIRIILHHLPNSIPPLEHEVKEYEKRLPEAVELVCRIVRENRGALLIHCHAGNDRTGGVLTGYLSKTQGVPPSDALRIVRQHNPEAISAPGYEEMMLSILEAEYGPR